MDEYTHTHTHAPSNSECARRRVYVGARYSHACRLTRVEAAHVHTVHSCHDAYIRPWSNALQPSTCCALSRRPYQLDAVVLHDVVDNGSDLAVACRIARRARTLVSYNRRHRRRRHVDANARSSCTASVAQLEDVSTGRQSARSQRVCTEMLGGHATPFGAQWRNGVARRVDDDLTVLVATSHDVQLGRRQHLHSRGRVPRSICDATACPHRQKMLLRSHINWRVDAAGVSLVKFGRQCR
jgi:hypothetical protein